MLYMSSMVIGLGPWDTLPYAKNNPLRMTLFFRELLFAYVEVRQDPPLTLIEPLTLSETRSAKACPYAF